IFLPLARVQDLFGRQDQANQVLIVNRGDATERLNNSWPITVELRSAFADTETIRRLYRAMASPPARDLLARAIASPDATGLLGDKLRRLQQDLDRPDAINNPEL